jgi:hypothetical protein
MLWLWLWLDFVIKANLLPLGPGQEIGFIFLLACRLIFLFPLPKGWRKI